MNLADAVAELTSLQERLRGTGLSMPYPGIHGASLSDLAAIKGDRPLILRKTSNGRAFLSCDFGSFSVSAWETVETEADAEESSRGEP